MATKQNSRSTAQTVQYDWMLAAAVLSLLAVGLVMVFSASYPQGMVGFDDPYYFIIRQLLWAGAGLVVMVVTARIPYQFWERWSILLMGVALVMLMAVILLGSERFGSTRTFFEGSVQPSEAAKIIILIYISAWLASKGEQIKNINYGLIPFGVLMGVVAGLIVAQPDISTAVLVIATATVLFFIAGAELKQLLLIGLLTGFTLWVVITQSSYANERIEAYLQSTENPLISPSWQIRNTVTAVVRGGPTGAGIGNSEMKLGWIPLGWSDNIFAIIGEELGLLGTLTILFLYALFAYRGFQVALRSPDNFGMLMATGITAMLIFQALLNVAVILALVPPTGVTLPFISFGGSSLVVSLGAVGLLLSVSRYGTSTNSRASQMGQMANARFDFGWRNRRPRLPGPGRGRTANQGSGSRPKASQRGGRRAGASSRSSAAGR